MVSSLILLFTQQNSFPDKVLSPGIEREITFSLFSQGAQSLEDEENTGICSLYDKKFGHRNMSYISMKYRRKNIWMCQGMG